MISRADIKKEAKELYQAQKTNSILIILVFVIVAGICAGTSVIFIGAIASFLITPVLSIGLYACFLKVYRSEKVEIGDLFTKFKTDYIRCLGGYWWMALFTFLWSMLFAIPGIVKMCSYFMTPYILADCPNVPAKEALKISMRMTKGYKGKIFVCLLSFYGWMMLSALTFGILYVVFVGPYMQTTFAGFYEEMKDDALRSGAISIDELT